MDAAGDGWVAGSSLLLPSPFFLPICPFMISVFQILLLGIFASLGLSLRCLFVSLPKFHYRADDEIKVRAVVPSLSFLLSGEDFFIAFSLFRSLEVHGLPRASWDGWMDGMKKGKKKEE